MVVATAGRSVDAGEADDVDWAVTESWDNNSSAGSGHSELPIGMALVVGVNGLDVCASGIGNGRFADPSK